MQPNLAQKAIAAALAGDWKKAVDINKQILQADVHNIDALNRLARAYAECGNFEKAKVLAEKVVKLDPFNTIATKSLTKWKSLKKGDVVTTNTVNPQLFLEEPGKTKIVSLMHTGDQNLCAKLDAGDEVLLTNHGHRASITTPDGKYVGRLPDDLSSRLRNLMNVGNKYKVFIKSSDGHDLKIFIRETFRSPKLADIPSFSTEKIDYVSFTSPELVHKSEQVPQQATADDEE